MRIFKKLDLLHQEDCTNNTKNVRVCPDMVSCDKKGKQGSTVTMGVPDEIAHEILNKEDKRIILLVVDGKEFDKLK